VLTPEHEFYSADLKNRYESDENGAHLLDRRRTWKAWRAIPRSTPQPSSWPTAS
jgi:hypothetical protein